MVCRRWWLLVSFGARESPLEFEEQTEAQMDADNLTESSEELGTDKVDPLIPASSIYPSILPTTLATLAELSVTLAWSSPKPLVSN